MGLLLDPKTPLPAGWSIDPVTGCCVRISDGARIGLDTSHAIAWSTSELMQMTPVPTGPVADVARLRHALGCAASGEKFTGDTKRDRNAAERVRRLGAQLAGDDGSGWGWRLEGDALVEFNTRLERFLDDVGVTRAHHPAGGEQPGEEWLVAGRIGRLAVRSATVVHGATASVAVLALGCRDEGTAMRQAHDWAIDAVRVYLAESARAAQEFVRHITFHTHDAACGDLTRLAVRVLASAEPGSAR